MEPLTSPAPLPAGFVPGARVERINGARQGTITRVIDAVGCLAGIVEVRWDGENRPSRSAGFFGGIELRLVAPEPGPMRHRSGLVWIG